MTNITKIIREALKVRSTAETAKEVDRMAKSGDSIKVAAATAYRQRQAELNKNKRSPAAQKYMDKAETQKKKRAARKNALPKHVPWKYEPIDDTGISRSVQTASRSYPVEVSNTNRTPNNPYKKDSDRLLPEVPSNKPKSKIRSFLAKYLGKK